MTHEPTEQGRHVDEVLAEALATTPCGVLVLLEPLVPMSSLHPRLIEALGTQLLPPQTLHVVSDDLVALICPSASLADGWHLVESLRAHFAEHRVTVNVGLGAWPMQGPTLTDVFAAAFAGLVDDRLAFKDFDVELESSLELEGSLFAWSMAGDLLSA
jgi:hypothetical protein